MIKDILKKKHILVQKKPNFSTLGCIVDISPDVTGSQIVFTPNDSIRHLLGFEPKITHEECNLTDYPVDDLSFDNIFIGTDIAQGIIFKRKCSGIIHNFTTDVHPGYKDIEEICGGVQWFMMESKDIISSIHFMLKKENVNLVSFNGPSISFRLSITKN